MRSRGAPTASIDVCHCVVSKPNWYKSSLVIATPIVCSSFVDLIMTVERQQAGPFLAYLHVQQVQNDANAVHLIQRRMRRRAPRRRRIWARQWLDVDRRLQYGHHHRLMYELRYEDHSASFMYDVDNSRGSNRDSTAAKKQREYLKLYFNSAAGSVPWQDSMI